MKTVSATLFAGIVGCAFIQPVPALPAAKYKILWSFGGSEADGQEPYANLIDVNGKLYGTTTNGGTQRGGTVFSVDLKTGKEKVLHSFCGGNCVTDGVEPSGSLIDVNGTLYGTTGGGGANYVGTIFSVDPKTGAEKVLYSFCKQGNCAGGAQPAGSLINVKSTFYGVTGEGGANCNPNGACGTVYSFDPKTGVETLLYDFEDVINGSRPGGPVLDIGGTLYGVTGTGGNMNCGSRYGCGVAFSLDLGTGAETVLYSFCSQTNCEDGYDPSSSLIDVNQKLYGMTSVGGGSTYYGTLYSLDPGTGAHTVVYSFCSQQDCADGEDPYGHLIAVNGALYGVTLWGGKYHYGTVFALDLSTGTETVVHSFGLGTDGNRPENGPIDVNGTLYGTTQFGGAYNNGTVYALTESR